MSSSATAAPPPASDPVALAAALVRCPSVTPEDAGALGVLEHALSAIGFECRRVIFEEDGTPPIDNLYARLGTAAPNVCFAGHTDVVPAGDPAAWARNPFGAEIEDGILWGRGIADMKGAIAAFCAAAGRLAGEVRNGGAGSISLLITGDEEGPAINGTRKLLTWLEEKGETLDFCIVGEPTNPERLGQMIKSGRRGSMNGYITVEGRQGHVAYPHRNQNPLPGLIRILSGLSVGALDEGTERFDPSRLEVTAIDVGQPAFNVIPGRARALFNARFSDLHTSASLQERIRAECDSAGVDYKLEFFVKGEPFYTEPGPLTEALVAAIEERLGESPELSTTGGTSDARYIKDYCPVVEFGLVGASMHAIDEHSATADIEVLADIYELALRKLLKGD